MGAAAPSPNPRQRIGIRARWSPPRPAGRCRYVSRRRATCSWPSPRSWIGSRPGPVSWRHRRYSSHPGNWRSISDKAHPIDVFLSANEAFVRDLASEGLIRPESVHAYARGSLVLAVYRDLGDKVGSLADLTKPEVKKIALANPVTAPYGKAGKQALERAGLWTKLEPKIVFAESVRQALLYAQKGDAEAALVGRAIASVPEIRPVEVDPALYDPIVQALGVVAASGRTGRWRGICAVCPRRGRAGDLERVRISAGR